MRTKTTKEQSAAVLTVRRVPDMTMKGRKAIAAWLRRQAFTIEHGGDVLADRFTARYLYR